jgi:hypothetical protein
MRQLFIIIIFLLVAAYKVSSQTINISGLVEEASTKERIISAIVLGVKNGKTVVTNDAGFFSLNVVKGDSILLVFNHASYEKQIIWLSATADTFVTIFLSPQT